MPRIPYPPEGKALPDVVAEGPGKGMRTLNVQRMLLHLTPAIHDKLTPFSLSLLQEGILDPILRELALVRVGLLSNSPYEVHHHDALALRVGVTQAKLDALRQDAIGDPFTPAEQAVLIFIDDMVKNVRPADATLSALQAHLTSAEIMELVLVSGMYMTVSRILETFGVDMDTFGLALPES